MESGPFWEWFCMTGEPMAYLLYRESVHAEKPCAF